MEGHHHVGMVAGIIGDVPHEELKPFIPEIRSHLIAEFDHIGFQVQADDFHVALLQHLQIIVDGESQIGFAAAEIDNPQRPAVRIDGQRREHILHNLQVPVDLAELAVMLLEHPAVPVHDSQTNEKVAGFSVGNDVILLFIMGRALRFFRTAFSGNTRCLRFGSQNLHVLTFQKHVDLLKLLSNQRKGPADSIFCRQVLVGHFFLPGVFHLKQQLTADSDRTDQCLLAFLRLFSPVAENHFDQAAAAENLLKNRGKLVHMLSSDGQFRQ